MMNYVGSISILDRGDAPAMEVIDRNTRSLAQRVSNETKEELNKVMTRVGNIYNAYDMSVQSQFDMTHSPNVEYIGDIKELESILTDTVKKKKYQQQVTVFIVGFQNVSSQKMQLLQQVNQFFLENSKLETDEVFPPTPDIDMEDVTKKIEESLITAESLAKRLGELNQEIINYLVNYANTKASNKGKKRLEKSLQQAKDDITSLSEKLLAMQTETDAKDEKLQQLYKQIDLKTSDVTRYKTAAEAAKKAAQDSNEQIHLRDEKINELQQKLNALEAELSRLNLEKEQNQKKMEESDASSMQKVETVQKELDDKKPSVDDTSQSLESQFHEQIAEIEKQHREETEELTKEHEQELIQKTEELEKALEKLATAERNAQAAADEVDQLRRTLIELQLRETPDHVSSEKTADDQSTKEDIEGDLHPLSRGDSRPSTKDTRSSRKSSTESKSGAKAQPAKSTGKSLLKPEGKSGRGKEYAEVSVQDEGGDPNTAHIQSIEVSRQPVRQSKLQPVKEGDVAEFTDAFDLSDNNAWSNIPQNQVVGRFAQYRRLTQHKIQELEEQVQLMMTKTHRKVNSLKAQFQEHKAKWEAERKVLIDQLEQAQKLQNEAEKEADAAMTQLEEFINEQEKLEEEEENKRTEITKSVSRPGTVPPLTPGGLDPAAKKSKTPEAMASVQAIDGSPRGYEQELQNLMQQTDDAKVQEKTSRTSGAMSAPPAVETDTQHDLMKSQTTQELPVEADSSTSLPAAPSQTTTSPSPVKQTPTPSQTKTPVSPPSPEIKPEQEKEKEKESSPVHSLSMSRQSTVPSLIIKSPVTSPIPNHKATQTQAEPISELEEEQHTRSAKSRASLRNQYKNKLDETRGAIEERRAKSPAISIPSQKSLDDDQLILEEEEEDIPVADDIKEEKKLAREETLDRGTSPPPTAAKVSAQRIKSVSLVDHPIVDEYLSTYEGVVSFRNQISKLLIEKEFLTQGQVVADLEMISFDRESKVLPQLQAMTQNVYEVLQEIAATTGSILFNDQEPVVSSIAMGVSRDQTRRTMYTREQSIDSQGGGRRSIQRTPSIKQVDKQIQESLQEQYNKLKQQLEEESRKHETQMRHNTVVMMEMQDTINELQRELSTLGKSARRPTSDMASTPGTVQPQAESGVMFTRLDSDRNAKIMKKAVMDQKLNPDKYKEVINQMDEYVSLPAKRLAHLVRKYVHHCRMKDIEENVKKSKSLNENVFEILDKMEALQNQRAKKWADKMDEMGIERLRLANLLMETLDNIEQESGIFLIKPMYSYRGREPKPSYAGKLSRPYRPHRVISPSRESASAYAPAPTPASNIRPVLKHMQQPLEYVANQYHQVPVRPLEGDPAGVMGSSVNWVGTPPKQTWSFSASHPRIDESLLLGNFNTPRMLELDINRMLIGQNTISARILPDYRLINTAQNLRSYMTVSRPTAPPGHIKSDHSRGFLESRDSPAPPSSPATGSFSAGVGQKRVRLALSDHESPRIPGTPPLPPIGGSKSKSPIKEPSGSPSGSSLTQSPSPLREVEIISPVK